MRLSLAAALPLLASAVSGFRLPAKRVEGVYRAYYDVSGNEVHERVADTAGEAANASVLSADLLGKRDTRIFCGCGFNMDTGDCDAAVADLENQFGNLNFVPPQQSFYSIRGSVVAFLCNY